MTLPISKGFVRQRLAPVVLAAVAAAPAAAATRTVDVEAFSEVDAANGVAVEITLGAPAAVVIDGPESRIDRVDVSVEGDVLRIRPMRRGWFRSADLTDVTVRVSVESLGAVDVANGAAVSLDAVPDDAELRLTVANGGVLEATGACRSVEVDVARGGMVDAGGLDCRDAVTEVSMGGMATVRASGSHVAEVSMGGMVNALGDADLESSASMGGMVSRGE